MLALSILLPVRLGLSILAAEEFHDIAPPVDYSLIPRWMVLSGALLALIIAGLLVWFFLSRRKPAPVPTARQRALQMLARIESEIESANPYKFSIRVSDILRRYVTEQYDLPLTRQTSVEFLNAAAKSPAFSEEDKSLLGDFLNRCDLIKFARYDATIEDSRHLLEEAKRFVEGGKLELA